MSKSIKTLVEDVNDVLRYPHKYNIQQELVELFAHDVSQLLVNKLVKRPKTYDNALRMSALGNPDRQLWYKVNKPELAEEFEPNTYLKFLYGDMTEELILFLVRAAGHEVTCEQKEVNIDGVVGHIDCIIDGVLIDIKSASAFGYKKFKEHKLEEDDPFGYIDQLNSYLFALSNDPHLKIKKEFGFLAFDKQSGQFCLDLYKSTNKDYSAEIERKREFLAKDKPPERCHLPLPDGKSGNLKLCTQCSYCSFKKACYPELRTFIYSNGPRFLTHVERVPDVYEVKD